MSTQISRRTFLRGAAMSAMVVGFDLKFRSWLTPLDLPSALVLAPDFPEFDGELLTDDASLDAGADDFGHIVHRRPIAVLRPGSVNDIITLISFAREHKIQVAARGQGHATQGQGQVEAGVVIDMAALNQIHEITSSEAFVDAGITWFDLLVQTVQQGLTPPVLTDYLNLGVGGTLSVGGVGGQAFRFGSQTDNVTEMEVVTGRGELVTCSPGHNQDLFDAVRAGLGQFGVIVRARVGLIAAPEMVRVYTLPYIDHAVFMADQEQLIDDAQFDYVEGLVVPDGSGGWLFLLEAAKYFNPGDELDNNVLLNGLSFLPGGAAIEDKPYFNPPFPPNIDFANRLAPLVTFLQESGLWDLPHPWLNLFIPATEAVSLVGEIFRNLTPDDVGPGGVVLLYPMNRSKFNTPFMHIPDNDHFFILSLLRTAPTLAIAEAMIEANRQLFDQTVALDGKRYPIDSVLMDKHDWQKHFQPKWGPFVAAKHHFDPDNIMTPGQGIF